MNPKRFLAELKRRNVYRAAVLYGMGAWLLAQIATQIFPFFDVPNSAVRFVIVSLSQDGSEEGTAYVYEVATGKRLADTISGVMYPTAGGSVEWAILSLSERCS